jgi:hypothetical protein
MYPFYLGLLLGLVISRFLYIIKIEYTDKVRSLAFNILFY